ncbi:hypothetical protein B4Q13_24960, partial [Lacticaseibacillus rhamnosus]
SPLGIQLRRGTCADDGSALTILCSLFVAAPARSVTQPESGPSAGDTNGLGSVSGQASNPFGATTAPR